MRCLGRAQQIENVNRVILFQLCFKLSGNHRNTVYSTPLVFILITTYLRPFLSANRENMTRVVVPMLFSDRVSHFFGVISYIMEILVWRVFALSEKSN